MAESIRAGAVEADPTRHQERRAWAIVWLAFCAFCLVALLVPIGVLRYREAALAARGAKLEVIAGTVLLHSMATGREVAYSAGVEPIGSLELAEGDRIRTTAGAKALVGLFDGSTLQLWPETSLTLRTLRRSAFTDNLVDVEMLQSSGHTRVDVAVPTTVERSFALQTPHGAALLREGSYRVEVADTRTQLTVRAGSASVSAVESVVEVLRGEQTTVVAGQTPSRPAPATRNLVENGDFAAGFAGWQRGSRNEEDGVAGNTYVLTQDGRRVVRLLRQGSQKHGETYLHQVLDADVTDFDSLRLVLDVKLLEQTLSGGGWLGSEYPLLVRVRYRDAFGSEAEFIRGFYYVNEEGRPTTNGMLILAQQWLTFSADLFDLGVATPRPAHLLWLEIESSGWEYDAQVTNVQLQAE